MSADVEAMDWAAVKRRFRQIHQEIAVAAIMGERAWSDELLAEAQLLDQREQQLISLGLDRTDEQADAPQIRYVAPIIQYITDEG